ncbi:B-cell CLL/lymphoma 7 protein family member B isoform X2 [Mauremys mutica]|uniref:B-cell CLL/lymphoma 7 protein family member B isoform X2 n=1 Tax=Mauremys mutica TaxID=74926 RepID=UPI001D166A65|nr:B-cell CLL/lymphoma 7 protein family member B isoform X2 [Mauremys mutica]
MGLNTCLSCFDSLLSSVCCGERLLAACSQHTLSYTTPCSDWHRDLLHCYDEALLDETSNQSSLSDVYQLKVDSSPNSSLSPQQSESMSPAHTSDFRTDDSQPPTLGQEILEEPCLPSSEVADEPPTLTKEEPVPLETQETEEEDSGAPPLKRFCADQNSVCHTASES